MARFSFLAGAFLLAALSMTIEAIAVPDESTYNDTLDLDSYCKANKGTSNLVGNIWIECGNDGEGYPMNAINTRILSQETLSALLSGRIKSDEARAKARR